jgi:hypothetical protein
MPDLEPITREEMLLDGQDLEPITRKEMFIKRIYDKTQVVPEPITREEMFLKKAGDETTDVTIEQLNVSENGTYSESGKAYSPVIVNVPAPPIPDNAYLLNEVEGLPSDIASFSDGSNLPMPKLQVGIEPVQDLHGYDHPWVGGSGKNKIPMTVDGIKAVNTVGTWNDNVYSYNGLTFTIQTDDGENIIGISINGTVTGGESRMYLTESTEVIGTLVANKIINGCPLGGSSSTYAIYVQRSSSPYTVFALDIGNGSNIGDSTGIITRAFIEIKSGYTANNLIFKPMIRLATETDATFAPYSNICPISGHTEANVVVSPTTSAEDGTTYTIQFKDGDNPLTVYGGSLDVVSGELKVVPYYASYNDETLEGEWISDRDVYAVGTTPTIGAQVVNIGATPTTYQLTPTQVNSLLGTNNVWADTGDIEELEYFSKEV